MSTIDEKYLGDRIKALEENITDTVAEGSTAVPTAGAVYNAIQSGAVRYVVPNAVQTANDNIFCCTIPEDSTYVLNDSFVSQMTIYNNTFKLSTRYLWIKNSAFGIDETQSVENEFYSKFIMPILPLAGANTLVLSRLAYSSNANLGYTVLDLPNATGIITLMLQ